MKFPRSLINVADTMNTNIAYELVPLLDEKCFYVFNKKIYKLIPRSIDVKNNLFNLTKNQEHFDKKTLG